MKQSFLCKGREKDEPRRAEEKDCVWMHLYEAVVENPKKLKITIFWSDDI